MKRFLFAMSACAILAPTAASLAAEPPLMCFGNEPFWGLDLTAPGRAVFSTPDTEPVVYEGTATRLAFRGESAWRGAATPGGGELVAFLREGACSDGMSDTVHPYAVNVSLPGGRHLAGCCRLAAAPAAPGLGDGTWQLTGLPGQALPARPGQAVTLRFADGRVQGFSGCNQFSGAYTLEGERLVVGNVAGTMMACDEPAMAIERSFLAAFSGALDAGVTDGRLTLTPAGGGEPLQFEAAPPPRLEGATWEVTGYNNGRQAVVSPLEGTRLTVEFNDGQVSGSSGCNRFHGSFTADGNALAVGQLGTTRMACDEAVMAQERAFLEALGTASTWTIDRGTLDVHRPDGERVLWARPATE